MICSLNEIGATLRKAATGVGYSPGLAQSIAAAGVWLCARGLDGITGVLAATDGAGEDLRIDHRDNEVRVVQGWAGLCGPSVFELLAAKSVDRVVIEQADSPLLLVGFAGTTSAATGGGFTISIDGYSPIETDAMTTTLKGDLSSAGQARLEIGRGEGSSSARPSLPRGVDVNLEAWTAALALAARTYVPATEESRLKGAGAGLTDND